jgi:hypothetical protein
MCIFLQPLFHGVVVVVVVVVAATSFMSFFTRSFMFVSHVTNFFAARKTFSARLPLPRERILNETFKP